MFFLVLIVLLLLLMLTMVLLCLFVQSGDLSSLEGSLARMSRSSFAHFVLAAAALKADARLAKALGKVKQHPLAKALGKVKQPPHSRGRTERIGVSDMFWNLRVCFGLKNA